MKTFVKNIIIPILVLTIFSCNKDDDAPIEERVRLIAYSVGANEYDLRYNEDGFLTRYGSSDIIYNVDNKIVQNGSARYEYNGQGRVSKVIRSNRETTIVYNNMGLMATFNTVYNSTDRSKTTFEYDSQNRLTTLIEENFDASRYYKITLTYDTKDNIVQYLIEYSLDGISYTEYSVSNYTYDNIRNPNYNVLTKTGNSSVISVFPFISYLQIGNIIAYDAVFYTSKNNLLSSNSIYSSGSSNRTYEYVYDENSYPISVEIEYTVTEEPDRNNTSYKTWTYENY
ncbi:hypothetical protein FF125_15160 [Aureibaculum algae]|uniref:Teneurin-like YD-shell domain-containing protein n=1 Tax=Aureibaculum algae TaxID=2584122 RepID=A0A5B7TY60_9FLAO|nr:hypothetical protein [Aureibaculum algae]QCX39717.1 hypothetical protein FF125_15160 [Aureibaculum algae]